jgi:hypothetical protein
MTSMIAGFYAESCIDDATCLVRPDVFIHGHHDFGNTPPFILGACARIIQLIVCERSHSSEEHK